MKCNQCNSVFPPSAPQWTAMSVDVLSCITAYLDWIEILVVIRRVSKYWYQASLRLPLWRHGIKLCLCIMSCADYCRLPFDWQHHDPTHHQQDIQEPALPLYTDTFALFSLHQIKVTEIHLDMERLVACDPALIAQVLPDIHTVVLYNKRYSILKHAYFLLEAFPKIRRIRANEMKDIQSFEYWPVCTIPFQSFSFAWIYRPHLEIFCMSLCMQAQLQELYIKDMSDSLEDTVNGLCLFQLQALQRLEITCGPTNPALDVSWFSGTARPSSEWTVRQLRLNNVKLQCQVQQNLWYYMRHSLTGLYLQDVMIQDVVPMLSLHVLQEWTNLSSLQSEDWNQVFSVLESNHSIIIWPCLKRLQVCLDTALIILPMLCTSTQNTSRLMPELRRLRVDTRHLPCARMLRCSAPRRTRPEWQNRSSLRHCRSKTNQSFLHNVVAPLQSKLQTIWPQVQIECTHSNEYPNERDLK